MFDGKGKKRGKENDFFLQWPDEVANPSLVGFCKSSKEAFYSLFAIAKKTFQAKMNSFLSDPCYRGCQSWVVKRIKEMEQKLDEDPR
jgi:hypothetical protein